MARTTALGNSKDVILKLRDKRRGEKYRVRVAVDRFLLQGIRGSNSGRPEMITL